MSLIEKIDAMDIAPFLTVDMNIGYQTAIRDIKQIILSEQKEPLTIGDKIRESNESLAEFINEVLYYCIYKSKYKSNCGECRLFEVCRKAEGSDAGWYLDYLNQPYTE